MYYVYAHYTADTNELFYIGKGTKGRVGHKTRRSAFWNAIVAKHGIRTEILISNLNESDAYLQEILAIREFKPKANMTKGGSGGYTGPNSGNFSKGVRPWNTGKVCPSISEQQRGEKNPNYGVPSPRRVRVKCVNDGQVFDSIKEASLHYGIAKSLIHRCIRGQLKQTRGFQFMEAL